MGNNMSARDAFEQVDTDTNGLLDFDEIQAAVGQMGHSPDDAKIRKWIKDHDQDGDGQLDFEEFQGLMAELHGTTTEPEPVPETKPPPPPESFLERAEHAAEEAARAAEHAAEAAAKASANAIADAAHSAEHAAEDAANAAAATAADAANAAADGAADVVSAAAGSAADAAGQVMTGDDDTNELRKALSVAQAEAHFNKGEAHERQYKWVEAEREYRAAMKADAGHPRASERHAHAEAQVERQRREAERDAKTHEERVQEADEPMAQRTARAVLRTHAIDEATINLWRDAANGSRCAE
jgi:hypothetical protein